MAGPEDRYHRPLTAADIPELLAAARAYEQVSSRRSHPKHIETPRRSVAFDPSAISPQAIQRIVAAAVALCADVEGLTNPPGTSPEIATRILRAPMLQLRLELARAGQIKLRPELDGQ